MRSTSLASLALALSVFGSAAVSHATTPAEIDGWARTLNGVDRIAQTVAASNETLAVRVYAANALVALHHPAADGREVLRRAVSALPAASAQPLMHEVASSLVTQLRALVPASHSSDDDLANGGRLAATAYQLGPFAAPADAARMADVSLDWLLAETDHRSLAGPVTGDMIIRSVGARAAPRLIAMLGPHSDEVRISGWLARSILAVGTERDRDAAVARLVQISTEIHHGTHDAALRSTAQEILSRRAGSAAPPDDARVERAVHSLQNAYGTVLLEAIHILDRPAGIAYFRTVAADTTQSDELRAAARANIH